MTIEIDVEVEELPQLLIEIARLISEGFTSGYLLDGYWSIHRFRNKPKITPASEDARDVFYWLGKAV